MRTPSAAGTFSNVAVVRPPQHLIWLVTTFFNSHTTKTQVLIQFRFFQPPAPVNLSSFAGGTLEFD
jgi:hypothetical protein